MSKAGGRLNLIGAMNRKMPPSHLTPLSPDSSSKHATVSRLEKELKMVKEENENLKTQLEDARSALRQLTSEASYEKFDERRVNLLKMQLIQLQRQVLLMTEALGSRSTALMEAENALTWLSETFRRYIGADVKGGEVPVPRSELITMVETSESARIKLFKNIENCTRENLARPLMFMNPFLQPGEEKDFTVLDTCLGRTDCLNLKHVTQLESKLSTLYKELIKVSQSLEVKSWANHDPLSSHVAGAVRERVQTVVLRAGAMARDCAADLLSLSLLYPSAPWPPLKKPTMTEVTYEALAPALPSLPRSKAGEVQRCVTSALKACNHRCHMLGQEVSALREEVRFHQDVYDIQLNYVQQVFAALSNGYADFEKSTGEVIVQPMKKLMNAYDSLKATSSEKSLREFLLVIKENAEQWRNTIATLDTAIHLDVAESAESAGSLALSAFGEDFMSSLHCHITARQKEREQAAANKLELKVVQQQLEDELRALIKDAEEQQKIAEEVKASSSGDSRKVALDSSRSYLAPDGPPNAGGHKPVSDSTLETDLAIQTHQDKPHKVSYLKKKASKKPPWVDDFTTGVGDIESGSSNDKPVPENERPVTDDTMMWQTQLRHSSSDPQYLGVETSEKRDVRTRPDLDGGFDDEPLQRLPLHSDLTKQKPPSASGQTKSRPKRNYEPKLYVANRTLSLRRSGSLTKLSEPTLEEKLRNMSISRQDGASSAASKGEWH